MRKLPACCGLATGKTGLIEFGVYLAESDKPASVSTAGHQLSLGDIDNSDVTGRTEINDVK